MKRNIVICLRLLLAMKAARAPAHAVPGTSTFPHYVLTLWYSILMIAC